MEFVAANFFSKKEKTMEKLTRRRALKALGLFAGSTAFGKIPTDLTFENDRLPLDARPFFETKKPERPVTAICLGAGQRGNVYGNFALKNPDELDIIGVAEPIAIRNKRYSDKHKIAENNRFSTWEDVFKKPKMADAVLITMPDNLHYKPCMAALAAGYDVLLEKPIAPTEKECRDILSLAHKTGRIVAVCHVLRYAPYFIKLREIMQSGALGEVVSVQHLEPIEHIHMSHSYVRGNWHNSRETTPIILAKSCHDLDILRWLLGKSCKKVVAMGQLSWFRAQNAPAGSTARCMDGCAVEMTCPYSALKIYHKNRGWTGVFDLPDDKEKHSEAILEYLRTTNYGRCVYKMDNDQPDHYIASLEFEGGTTAALSMEAFSGYAGRRTRVFGSMGDVVGDMDTFTVTDFRTGEKKVFEAKDFEGNYKNSGHGGGDFALVHDWVQAVSQRDPGLLTSTIDASIESHLMGFAAEKSRKTGKVTAVKV